MSDAPSLAAVATGQLSVTDKALIWGSWLLAGYLFLTVGWSGMRPDDPQGAVSLLGRSGAILMVLQAGALAAVTAALGTVLAGRRLVEVGSFASAVGLALVSLRGATIEPLLLYHANASGGSHRGLAVLAAIEAVCWFVVMVIVLIVSGFVMQWCFGGDRRGGVGPTFRSVRFEDPRIHAAFDLGGVLPLRGARAGSERTPLADGIRHTVLTVLGGVAAFNIVSTGWSSRAIEHGQVCFVIAASFCAAGYVAHRFAPVRSALWSVLAVGVVAVGGYVWAAVRPGLPVGPASIPGSNFLRILPIQFISVGTAACIAMFWYLHLPEEEAGGVADGPAGYADGG